MCMNIADIDVGLLSLFVVLTVVNVVLNTARTIITVKNIR